jgi:hypothetical protein
MRHCFCPMLYGPGDNYDGDLLTILEAIGADEHAAFEWTRAWEDVLYDPSPEKVRALWQRQPCPPTTPPKVLQFVFVDLVRHAVYCRLQTPSYYRVRDVPEEGPSAEAVEVTEPRDVNGQTDGLADEDRLRAQGIFKGSSWPSVDVLCEGVVAMLIELGQHALAIELLDHPVQFWLRHYQGWAEATAKAAAHMERELEPWMSDLVAAAKECITVHSPPLGFLDGVPNVTVESNGERVVLPRGYRLDIPMLVLNHNLAEEPPAIWIRPNVPYPIDDLPIKVSVKWPGMSVDVRRLAALFEEVSEMQWTDAVCKFCGPAIAIAGKYRGHPVELAVRPTPRPCVEHSIGWGPM